MKTVVSDDFSKNSIWLQTYFRIKTQWYSKVWRKKHIIELEDDILSTAMRLFHDQSHILTLKWNKNNLTTYTIVGGTITLNIPLLTN